MKDRDVVMAAVKSAYEKSKLTLEELGKKMDYPKQSARKSAWQFLNNTNDPRISMLRKFAKAIGVRMKDLF